MDPWTTPDARIRERARAGALRVATFNIRMCVDRYPERRPWVVHALAEQEADVVLLQEVIDGGALGAALGLGQAADLTAALNTERAKDYVVRAQLARAPVSEPSPSYRCYAHSEPGSTSRAASARSRPRSAPSCSATTRCGTACSSARRSSTRSSSSASSDDT